MINDVWQQWQSLIASGLGASPQPRNARDGASAPFFDAAERYAAAARSFFDHAASAAASNTGVPGAAAPGTPPLSAADAAALFSNLLREQFADFQMPWNAAVGGDHGTSPAFSFDAPALGAARERQLRLQRMGGAWLRIEDAQRRLQRLWSDALREAATAFAARCVPSLAPNTEELHKLYDAWVDCAEEAYARTARTEEFCSALAELVNAGSAWRREAAGGRRTVGEAARSADPCRDQYAHAPPQVRRAAIARRTRRGPAGRPKRRQRALPSSPRNRSAAPGFAPRARAVRRAPPRGLPRDAKRTRGRSQIMIGEGLRAALAAANHCAPGCSPKDAVWQSGKLTLYRYRPIAPRTAARRC